MSEGQVVFNLLDTTFAHDNCTVAGVRSSKVQWDRGWNSPDRPTFFSHEQMFSDLVDHVPFEKRFGLIIESESIIPEFYENVCKRMQKFKCVFTHSAELLSRFENARWIPGGGTWIGGSFAGGEAEIYPKSRMCSIVSSHKVKTRLHRRRYLLAWNLRIFSNTTDVFMPSRFGQSYLPIGESLRDYRYSIVIENFIGNGYFTEKILNCFAMGTVPVYLGAPDVADYFDDGGIIQARSIRDIRTQIIPSLSEEDYLSRIGAITTNFHIGSEYGAIEDFIIRRYGHLLDH